MKDLLCLHPIPCSVYPLIKVREDTYEFFLDSCKGYIMQIPNSPAPLSRMLEGLGEIEQFRNITDFSLSQY